MVSMIYAQKIVFRDDIALRQSLKRFAMHAYLEQDVASLLIRE